MVPVLDLGLVLVAHPRDHRAGAHVAQRVEAVELAEQLALLGGDLAIALAERRVAREARAARRRGRLGREAADGEGPERRRGLTAR